MDISSLTLHKLIAEFERIELWRDIPGFSGYSVSSWGRVRGARGALLQLHTAHGYEMFSAYTDGHTTSVRVARSVALAFLGPPPFDGAHAAHNDGVKSNNRISNIRWATPVENSADVERHGNRTKGSDVFGAVLTEADIPTIRVRARSGERMRAIANDFGVSVSTISLIKLGRIWKHV